ncbi:MAG: TolC family protein [Aquificaceae bacterium]|nr:TolC family protein [Aquificaceae bacterium]
MRLIFALLLFFGFIRAMTLEEAISLALSKSKTLEGARLEVEASKLELSAQRQAFLPTFFLSYRGALQAKAQELELGFLGLENLKSSKQTVQSLQLGLRAQLFDGGLRASLVDISRHSLSQSKLKEIEKEQSIKLEAGLAFIDALKNKELVEIQKKQLENVSAILTQREAFFKAGLITLSEVLQARVRLAEVLRELQRAESQLKLSLQNLQRLTGQEVKSLSPPGDIPQVKPLEEFLKKAEQRASLKILREQARLLSAQRQAELSAIYPQVNLDAIYIYSDQNLAIKPRGNFQLGLSVDFSIRGLESLRRASAIFEREKAILASLEEERELIRLAILQSYEEYLISMQNLNVARENLKYAEELFRLSKKQYENQIITGLELLDAEASLTQARKAEAIAKYDVFRALLTLKRNSGEL